MNLGIARGIRALALFIGLSGLAPAWADPEIMVHENDLAAPGEIAFTLHANHALRGDRHTADGTWPAHRLSNLMAEFATGIAPAWEAGIHLPAMRAGVDSPSARRGQWGASAVMFRVKHIRELAGGYFVGFNAEYDINAKRYVQESRGVEFRGIAGIDAERYRLTVNPHLMWGWGNGVNSRPDFNVDFKALHKASPGFGWGAELYSDWGKAHRLHPGRGDRTLYLVGEFEQRFGSLHLGLGRGFRETPEKRLIKAVWAISF